MNIAIISRGDASTGGAGNIATILSDAMNQSGFFVRHIVRIQHPSAPQQAFRKCMKGIRGDILLRNAIGIDISGIRLIFSKIVDWADIVHFHDISVGYGIMPALWLSNKIPIFITLHDFSMITGGCIAPQNCRQYLDSCGHCPQIGNSPLTLPFDTTRYHYKLHYKLLSKSNVTIISPSDFILNEAKKGAGRSAKIIRIDNPVDTHIFTPEHRIYGRQELLLSINQRAVLFIASQIDNPIKGLFDFFIKYQRIAVNKLDWVLLIVGNAVKPITINTIKNVRVRYLGIIEDKVKLAKIYAASDCTVIPSIADNVPCTISESLCCGTPVIVRRVGGMPEMFIHGHHGVVIEDNTDDEWEKALTSLLKDESSDRRSEIREYAKKRYCLASSIYNHMKLYKSLFSSDRI